MPPGFTATIRKSHRRWNRFPGRARPVRTKPETRGHMPLDGDSKRGENPQTRMNSESNPHRGFRGGFFRGPPSVQPSNITSGLKWPNATNLAIASLDSCASIGLILMPLAWPRHRQGALSRAVGGRFAVADSGRKLAWEGVIMQTFNLRGPNLLHRCNSTELSTSRGYFCIAKLIRKVCYRIRCTA